MYLIYMKHDMTWCCGNLKINPADLYLGPSLPNSCIIYVIM